MPLKKPFWKSKTVLVNALAAAVVVFLDHDNPAQVAQALALVNILLRCFTRTGITAHLR